MLYLGIAGKFRDIAEATGKNRLVQALVFMALFLVTTTVLQLPLDAYQQSISLKYGLSVQGWGSWLGDQGKGVLVALVMFTILAWLFTTIVRKSPRRWWLYNWLIVMCFVVFIIFIQPVVIDPLFNKFEPLDKTNPELVTAIQQVTHRGGIDIPRDRMFLMARRRSRLSSALHFTGFGPSSAWWFGIQRSSTPSTGNLFIFGAEMGHYVFWITS